MDPESEHGSRDRVGVGSGYVVATFQTRTRSPIWTVAHTNFVSILGLLKFSFDFRPFSNKFEGFLRLRRRSSRYLTGFHGMSKAADRSRRARGAGAFPSTESFQGVMLNS